MATSFTPGPWRWVCREGDHYVLLGAGDARVHDDGSAGGEYIPAVDVPNGPNARLIAAAPDLYEALRRLLPLAEQWDAYEGVGAAIPSARAALAKAEGRDV